MCVGTSSSPVPVPPGAVAHDVASRRVRRSERSTAAAQPSKRASPEGRLQQLCYKTRMCKFFAMGHCDRGSQCNFAHDEMDLHVVPDLSFTQVCPVLISTGSCEIPDCHYAHNASELRRGPFASASASHEVARHLPGRGGQSGRRPGIQPPRQEDREVEAPAMDRVPSLRESAAGTEDAVTAPTESLPQPPAAHQEAPRQPRKHAKRARALASTKTRLCVFHQAGWCFKKDRCDFAHSLEELRRPEARTPSLSKDILEDSKDVLQPQNLHTSPPEASRVPPQTRARAVSFSDVEQRFETAWEEDGEVVQCNVKNTFVNVEMAKGGLRKTLSCPALSHVNEEEEEDEESDGFSSCETEEESSWTRVPTPPTQSPTAVTPAEPPAKAAGSAELTEAWATPAAAPPPALAKQVAPGPTAAALIAPPMRLCEAYNMVPALREQVKMVPAVLVPMCALQKDLQLLEVRAFSQSTSTASLPLSGGGSSSCEPGAQVLGSWCCTVHLPGVASPLAGTAAN